MTVDSSAAPSSRTGGAGTGNLFAAIVLSFLIAAALLVSLVYRAGAWEVLGMTRLLDLLIAGGIIQYHDQDPGFIQGIPSLKLYVWAKDAVDWRLVMVSAVIFMLYSGLKAIQFGRIARAYGLEGTPGTHVRAFLYGDGLDRILPFKLGAVATATSLARQGASADRAASAVFVTDAFAVFEIAFFGGVGLLMMGWSSWLGQILWGLGVFGVLYAIVRGSGSASALSLGQRSFRAVGKALSAFARNRPGELVGLCLLSLIAFMTLDLAFYVLMMAFDTVNVLINVDAPVLMMAIVAGYIARLIPLTPGGIGQFEIGFATAFLVGGQDVSLSLTVIALTAALMRVVTGLLLTGFVAAAYGAHTNLREVLGVFSRAQRPEGA